MNGDKTAERPLEEVKEDEQEARGAHAKHPPKLDSNHFDFNA